MGSKLESVLLQELMRGDEERFVLREGAEAQLTRALDQDLEGPDPLASVRAALAFCAACDGRLASPGVAKNVRAVLRREPRVMLMLKARVLDEQQIDRMRSFVRGEGREVVMRAPMFGGPPQRRGGVS